MIGTKYAIEEPITVSGTSIELDLACNPVASTFQITTCTGVGNEDLPTDPLAADLTMQWDSSGGMLTVRLAVADGYDVVPEIDESGGDSVEITQIEATHFQVTYDALSDATCRFAVNQQGAATAEAGPTLILLPRPQKGPPKSEHPQWAKLRAPGQAADSRPKPRPGVEAQIEAKREAKRETRRADDPPRRVPRTRDTPERA